MATSPPEPTPKRPQSFEDVETRRKKYQGVATSKTAKLAEQVSPETSSTRTPSDASANPSPHSVSEAVPSEPVEEKPRKRLRRVNTSEIPPLGDTTDTSKAKTATIPTEKHKMSEPPTNEAIPGDVPTEAPGSQSHDVPT